jgi:hypothetical protein
MAPEAAPPAAMTKKAGRILPPLMPLTPEDLAALATAHPRELPPRAVAWTMDVWSSVGEGAGVTERRRGVLELDADGGPAILYAIGEDYERTPRLSCDDGGVQRRAAMNPATGAPSPVRIPAAGRKVCAGESAESTRRVVARSEETSVFRPLSAEGDWASGGQLHEQDAVVTYFEDRTLLGRTPPTWGVVEARLYDSGDRDAPRLGPNPVELDIGWLRRRHGSVEWSVTRVDGKPFRVDFEDQGTITGERGQFSAWTERERLGHPYRSFVVGTREPFGQPREVYRAVTEFLYVPFTVPTRDVVKTVTEFWAEEAKLAASVAAANSERLTHAIEHLAARGLEPPSSTQLSAIATLERSAGGHPAARRATEALREAAPDSVGVGVLSAGIASADGSCARVRDSLVRVSRQAVVEPRELAGLSGALSRCGAAGEAWRVLESSSGIDYRQYGYEARDMGELALLRGKIGLKQGNFPAACESFGSAARELPEQDASIRTLMAEADCE